VLDFSRNHFELFGLPTRYRVDNDLLAQGYHALQQALHPDRYAAASDRERRLSLQASTHVNQAFQTLQDPVARARYLLSLHTGDYDDEQESTRDAAFLMEQMELREVLAEVEGQADPMAVVGTILDRLADHSSLLTGELETLLEEQPLTQDLEMARELVRKLQFIAKCRVEAENLEAKLKDISQ